MAFPIETVTDADLRYHYRTYRGFVFAVLATAAHALLILALLAYFFA
ncbi:MAG: hypothetical protein K8F92_01175 [Hyphomicrobium sp.]|nr:hypothetical protein [Hyphomicrobium sp.]MBZ0208253.1 hypothetical protein [Hyphomicrobium sp.]MCZ7595686.1 hypothetical protein [Hyphomicrobium sp.]